MECERNRAFGMECERNLSAKVCPAHLECTVVLKDLLRNKGIIFQLERCSQVQT